MGRTLVKIAGLLLGMLLIITGLAKVATFGEFAAGIVREVPVPSGFGGISALVIVASEVLAGAGFYFHRVRRLSAVVAALLFFLFTILTLHKIAVGAEFQCDCFGILGLQLSLVSHFLLDAGLTSVAVLVAFMPAHQPLRISSARRLPVGLLLPLLLLVIVLAWALFSAFRPPTTVNAPEEKRTKLDIAFPVKCRPALRGTLVKGISTSGLLRPLRNVDVMPKLSGEIISTNTYEGKEVSQGEILATIDSAEFRLAYDRASSALLAAQIEYRTLSASPFLQIVDSTQARRDLEAARDNYQRVRIAYAAGRIDGPAFLRAQREYEATRAYFSANREDVIANRSGLVQAREAFERARRDLEATRIRAPFAGRIAGWEGAVGMQTQMGRPLCGVVDISKMLVDADIVEKEAESVHPGESAVISCLAFPGISFPGRVCAVSPVIDLKSRMMRVALEVSMDPSNRTISRARLRPGMFASVLIETDRLGGRLLVPREAVLVRDMRQLVFTIDHGLAKWHYVELGDDNQDFVEVRSGLSEGDTVIVEGHQALAHDARVFVKD
jgi:RND family efflux transporter MFP subunit